MRCVFTGKDAYEVKELESQVVLSIIIPHFNSPVLLEKLLDSIHVSPVIEVIVVDDNSDCADELSQIMDRNPGVRILKNNAEHPKGAGSCRNIGLQHASGMWLTFADADDYYLAGFEDIVLSVIKQADDDVDIVYFPPKSIVLDTGLEGDRHRVQEALVLEYLSNGSHDNEIRLRFSSGGPWSKLIRRDLVERHQIKFDEVIASNDVMFTLKTAYNARKTAADSRAIYMITTNKGSLTMQTSEKVANARLDVFVNRCRYLRERLSKSDFKKLDFSGILYISNSILYKLGIKHLFYTYRTLRKNHIPVLTLNQLKPNIFLRKAFKGVARHVKARRFLIE